MKIKLRFRFMPTPSAPLHLGHAWLLFVTDTLIHAAKAYGVDADLVVVFDTINHADTGMCAQIIEDFDRLGIEVEAWQNNDAWPDKYTGDPPRMIRMNTLASPSSSRANKVGTADEFLQCVVGADYFARNLRIDMELGVTHVIRGFDQTNVIAVYHNLAELCEVTLPNYAYLPIIRGVGKRKLASHMPGLLVKDVTDFDTLWERMTCDFPYMCVNRKFSYATDDSPQSIVCGNDWAWILGGPGSEALKQNFLKRFMPCPCITDDITKGLTS